MNGTSAYLLSKKYIVETAKQFGGLKGASCEIESTEVIDNNYIINFVWENKSGETERTQLVIPMPLASSNCSIWKKDTDYIKDDIVFYNSGVYLCKIPNNRTSFNKNDWSLIGTLSGGDEPIYFDFEDVDIDFSTEW